MNAAAGAVATRHAHVHGSFLDDVLEGLGRANKRIPCKYFYDARGSELFERICELPEYYLTRTETAILNQSAGQIAERLGRGCLLIEPGSGNSAKTQILLDHLVEPAAYVPIDISPAALLEASRRLARRHPRLPVLPVCADYAAEWLLPTDLPEATRRAVFFPGSTLGNFEPHEARAFLRRLHHLCGHGGMLLIGVDLKKDPAVLHAAYTDAAGVTAQFNLNLLERINRELDADLDPDAFAHYAFYHPGRGRIEMHLVSRRRQLIRVAGRTFAFDGGESIHTENSYKYTPTGFTALACEAEFDCERLWTDPRGWFGLFMLRARSTPRH